MILQFSAWIKRDGLYTRIIQSQVNEKMKNSGNDGNVQKGTEGKDTFDIAGTFHRKPLPPSNIAFSSPEGMVLFQEAMKEGNISTPFFDLIQAFQTQGYYSFCGLGSLTMALNSLLIDPKRKIHGIWRWFDESMLNCCDPLETVKLKGISLPKLHCLARCQGASSVLKFASDFTEESLRDDILSAVRDDCLCEHGGGNSSSSCNGSSGSRNGNTMRHVLIACYDRRALGQTGSGHFSPIGGYHAGRDLVLILDVARFKYPPHWIKLRTLYEAMLMEDEETQKSRGYLLIGRPKEEDHGVFEEMKKVVTNRDINNRENMCCSEDKSIRECSNSYGRNDGMPSSSTFVHECSMCAAYTCKTSAAVTRDKNRNRAGGDYGNVNNDRLDIDEISDTDDSTESKDSGISDNDSVSSSIIATIDVIHEWLQRIYTKRTEDNVVIRKYLRQISIGIGVSAVAFALYSIQKPRPKILTLEEINELRIPHGW